MKASSRLPIGATRSLAMVVRGIVRVYRWINCPLATVDWVPSSYRERASSRDVRAGEGAHCTDLVQERLISIWAPTTSKAEHG